MKEYLFWRYVRKTVREECTIEANSLEDATKIHNEGHCDYFEVDGDDFDILDEGTEEIETKENKNDKQGIRHNQVV